MKASGVCLGGAVASATGSAAQSSDDGRLQRWMEQNAVSIQLAAAIGNARIVMLGEPSHGAGAAFAAKVRLILVLHKRLGFDVLAWESGLIDLERTEAGLRGDLDPVEAAQRGILRIWSASTECRPLFAYAKASHKSLRPLTMARFDMQLTAAGSLDYFAAELRVFVDSLDPVARSPAETFSAKMLNHFRSMYRYTNGLVTKAASLGRAGLTGAEQRAAMQVWRNTEGEALRPVPEDLEGLKDAAGALLHVLRKTGDTAAGGPSRRASLLIRAVASLAGYGANLLENYGRHSAEEAARYALTRENRRDESTPRI